ncbi:hypothetical protein Nepgr_026530 [Nepenthes gracilis]|uniref:Uncharacterized protein n=1 Tax=Nepenthes gracilis TaxID=150966 RepID=A0AAD3Y0G6_NEPGR|nr:hypothetical protein Nepgr_026530 [Nepenthes gracilis]
MAEIVIHSVNLACQTGIIDIFWVILAGPMGCCYLFFCEQTLTVAFEIFLMISWRSDRNVVRWFIEARSNGVKYQEELQRCLSQLEWREVAGGVAKMFVGFVPSQGRQALAYSSQLEWREVAGGVAKMHAGFVLSQAYSINPGL